MKKIYNSGESGQATTEMAIMLLGFAMLLVVLIISMSMEIFNIRVLLDARYRADHASVIATAGGAGREIFRWDYKNGIPFALSDEPIHSRASEMPDYTVQLDSNAYSNGGNYAYEWVKLNDFQGKKLQNDFYGKYDFAIDAANLIVKEGYSHDKMPLVGNRLPELFSAAAKLMKLRISRDRLQNNPSNRVYMPVNGVL